MTDCIVSFSQKASDQLETLYGYIAEQATPAIAAHYVNGIAALCRSLQFFPNRGTPRDDLKQGARSVPFKERCTIVYTVSEASVEISGIFYGGQDIAAAFDRS